MNELLTLDLYLRENAKSRPDWAPDQNEEKDAVIEFYKKEEAAHHYLPELADRSLEAADAHDASGIF